jgi:hypothetical protein
MEMTVRGRGRRSSGTDANGESSEAADSERTVDRSDHTETPSINSSRRI